jgi:Ca2+-binding EF-hand superfamily protein
MSVSSISSSTSSIDYTEMRKKMTEMMATKVTKDLDSDGDGAISKTELGKASQAASGTSSTSNGTSTTSATSSLDDLFTTMDADGDGSVTKSELSTFLEKAGPPEGAGGAPPSGGPPSGPPPGGSDSSTSTSSDSSSSASTATDTEKQTLSNEQRMAVAYQQLMAAMQNISNQSDSTAINSLTGKT